MYRQHFILVGVEEADIWNQDLFICFVDEQ